MVSRVVTDRKVGVLPIPGQEPVYVLLDETYDANSEPPRPRWCARTLGRYDQVLGRVFDDAAEAETGGLRSRRGRVRAESVLQRWHLAFNGPVMIDNAEVTLRVGGDDAPIPATGAAETLAQLAQSGYGGVADDLLRGPVTVRLYRDCDILVALYGGPSKLGLWRVLDAGQVRTSGNALLAPCKRSGRWRAPSMAAYTCGSRAVVAHVEGAPLRRATAAEHLARFALETALPAERVRAGAGKRALAAFRDVLQQARPLPDGVIVTLTGTGEARLFGRKTPRELLAALGHAARPGVVCGPFSFRVRESDEAAMQVLASLRDEALDWSLPAPRALAAHPSQAVGAATGERQLALF